MKIVKMIALSAVTSVSILSPISFGDNASAASNQSSITSELNSKVLNVNKSGLEAQIEVIEGTVENWTKLKVVNKTDGIIEYLTKTTENGTESINIETFYEANASITANDINSVEKHKVTLDSGTILLDGKKMNSETQTVAPSSIASATNNSVSVNSGATWYFVDKIEGSVNTNVATLGICISVLSMAIGSTAAAVGGLAVDIYGLKIPYTWYTKWKYSDKKVYQPMYLLNIYTYSDAKRTLQTGYTEYVL